jgi:hypothetical protein
MQSIKSNQQATKKKEKQSTTLGNIGRAAPAG